MSVSRGLNLLCGPFCEAREDLHLHSSQSSHLDPLCESSKLYIWTPFKLLHFPSKIKLVGKFCASFSFCSLIATENIDLNLLLPRSIYLKFRTTHTHIDFLVMHFSIPCEPWMNATLRDSIHFWQIFQCWYSTLIVWCEIPETIQVNPKTNGNFVLFSLYNFVFWTV